MPKFFELAVTYADEKLTLHSPESTHAKTVLPAVVGLVPGKNKEEVIHSVGIPVDIVAKDINERQGRLVDPFARATFDPRVAAAVIFDLAMVERQRLFPAPWAATAGADA